MIWTYLGQYSTDFDAENWINHVGERRERAIKGVSIFIIILGIDSGCVR